MAGTASVADIVRSTLADVRRLSAFRQQHGGVIAQELLQDLLDAQAQLARRIRSEHARFGGKDARFTGAAAVAYEAQIALAIQEVQNRINGVTERQGRAAITRSVKSTVALMTNLETRFTGITPVLRLHQAEQLQSLIHGISTTRLRESRTSVDRYGHAMIGEFEKMMRVGILRGASLDEMTAALTGHGGPRGTVSMSATVTPSGVIRLRTEAIPEGLFVRYRYWAERIVRTELMKAYNGARYDALHEIRGEFPDLQKKIIAILDNRTAMDSIVVNGQVRDLDAPFHDGAGREYQYPPARPNDRETTIPWRAEWATRPGQRPMDDVENALVNSHQLTPADQRRLLAKLRAGQRPEQAAIPGPTPRELREAELQRRGWPADAIAEDLAEMGFDPTPENIRAWAQRMRGVADRLTKNPRHLAPTELAQVRQGMRQLMRSVDPRFASGDVLDQEYHRHNFGLLSPAAARTAVATHNWVGMVRTRASTARDLGRAITALSRGRQPTKEGWDAIQAIFHEEHHGSSRIAVSAYRGLGAALEEATVESRARGMVRDLARHVGGDAPYRLPHLDTGVVTSSGYGAYLSQVNRFHEAVAAVRGLNGDQLVEYIQARLSEAWFSHRQKGDVVQTPEALIRRIAEVLHPEDPGTLQTILERELRRP